MENLNEEPIAKKSKTKLYLGIAILIIVILLIGGIFYYNSSKAINVYYEIIDSSIDSMGETEEYETLNGTIKLSANIDTQDEDINAIAQYVNDMKLSLNVQNNYKEKSSYINLNADYQDEKLIEGQVYYKAGDPNIYLHIEDLFDKYFKFDLNDLDENGELSELLESSFSVSNGNLNYSKAQKILKEEIKSQLKEEKFSQESANIIIDGKNVSTKKSTLKLTMTELKEIITNIANNLSSNEEFLNCYDENSREEIKTTLQQLTDLFSDIDEEGMVFKVDVYTKGIFNKEVVKAEAFVYDEEESVSFNIEKVADGNYQFSLKLEMSEDGVDAIAETFQGSLKIEEIDKNTEKVELNVNIPEIGNVIINMETSIIKDKELTKVDTSNSVSMDEMTEEDQRTMYNNLQTMRLYEFIQELM